MSSKNGISSDVMLALIVTILAFKVVETSAKNIEGSVAVAGSEASTI